MMRILLAAALIVTAASLLVVDVGAPISVGEPGFHGDINTGDTPKPDVMHAAPVIVHEVPSRQQARIHQAACRHPASAVSDIRGGRQVSNHHRESAVRGVIAFLRVRSWFTGERGVQRLVEPTDSKRAKAVYRREDQCIRHGRAIPGIAGLRIQRDNRQKLAEIVCVEIGEGLPRIGAITASVIMQLRDLTSMLPHLYEYCFWLLSV
jgi:hypothetical protein